MPHLQSTSHASLPRKRELDSPGLYQQLRRYLLFLGFCRDRGTSAPTAADPVGEVPSTIIDGACWVVRAGDEFTTKEVASTMTQVVVVLVVKRAWIIGMLWRCYTPETNQLLIVLENSAAWSGLPPRFHALGRI